MGAVLLWLVGGVQLSGFSTKVIAYNTQAAHVDRFLGLRCAADLLAARLFPNGKEVSESMAAWWAIRHYVVPGRVDERSDNVTVVVVGDGTKPRTAALIAHMTKWQCISIDPLLPNNGAFGNIERLAMCKTKVQHARLDLSNSGHVIVVGVHNHATVPEILSGILFDSADFVMIPCCVDQQVVGHAYVSSTVRFTDQAIWSPKNTVEVSLGVIHPKSAIEKAIDRYYFSLVRRMTEPLITPDEF